MDTVRKLDVIRAKRDEILRILDRYGATNPRVVGSVARGDDDSESDLDLMLDIPEQLSLLDVIGLERELSNLLHTPVQVCEENGLSPKVARTMLAEAISL
jgi:uncharacterized protein